MFNKTDVVKLLLENNANVNQATIGNRTPLFAAALPKTAHWMLDSPVTCKTSRGG